MSKQAKIEKIKSYLKGHDDLQNILDSFDLSTFEQIILKDSSYETSENLIINHNQIFFVKGDLRITGNLLQSIHASNGLLIVLGRLVIKHMLIGDMKLYVASSFKSKGILFEPITKNIHVFGKLIIEGVYTKNKVYNDELRGFFGQHSTPSFFIKEKLLQTNDDFWRSIQVEALFECLSNDDDPMSSPEETAQRVKNYTEKEEARERQTRIEERKRNVETIDLALFREHFFDDHIIYDISDCAIEDKNTFFFVAEKRVDDDSFHRPKRVFKVTINEPLGIKHVSLNGFSNSLCLGISFESIPRAIVIDMGGATWVNKSGENGGIEEMLWVRKGGLLRGLVRRVRSFGGFAICCTNGRDVLIRRGIEQWERIGSLIEALPKRRDLDSGFNDFDAFSMDDIYAGGGTKYISKDSISDLWHFDGQVWTQIDFPANQGIEAICCAGDGFVYIGTWGGFIYKGRGDQWTLIHDPKPISVSTFTKFNDIVWHEEKVWCACENYAYEYARLSVIEADTLRPIETPSSIANQHGGHLSVHDGVLLFAGGWGAAYHTQGEWKVLFKTHELLDEDL